jgi:DNA (cytosine-5)-methyltransferase 1
MENGFQELRSWFVELGCLPDSSSAISRTFLTSRRTKYSVSKVAQLSLIQSGPTSDLTALELCAGAGGQAIGLEAAGFRHLGLVELDTHACQTLRANSDEHGLGWNVIHADLNDWQAHEFEGQVDLLAGGLPCPPFSRAGKQLGEDDERNLWPAALRIVGQVKPTAIMFENVRGILDAVFEDFRRSFSSAPELRDYAAGWKMLNASDFGVSQLRPRVVFVAIRKELAGSWEWPKPAEDQPPTVGEKIYDLVAVNGWRQAKRWKARANEIAPTIVGGSHKHGGPDLGPTRARREWAALGVDGLGIANEAPAKDFVGMPRLTVRMVARLQGFPDDWRFLGGKTASYRQIGNAFPPPVAEAVARQIKECLTSSGQAAHERRVV